MSSDSIPQLGSFDSTFPLLREGYEFITERCRRLETDAFQTRLMLHPVICVSGSDAARMFYADGRFTRRNAMPLTTLKLLQDKGSVQVLDDEEHRHRKAMFLSLMTDSAICRLTGLFEHAWRQAVPAWQGADHLVLHDEMEKVLFRAAWRWVGLPPLDEEGARRRVGEMSAMIGAAASFGPRNFLAQIKRWRSERVIQDFLSHIREGAGYVEPDAPAAQIVQHRTRNGTALDLRVATVELINILRPIVAVSNYIVFIALALHRHPEWRQKVAVGDAEDIEIFVQEVRRFYPFFPFIGGRVRDSFSWHGRAFENGEWVLLDLYGTSRHGSAWEQPNTFQPERFRGSTPGAYDLIPQGGGSHAVNHRCPGEWITIALMKRAAQMLATKMHYGVPEQDLSIDLASMPAQPASGFVIDSVAPAGNG